MNLNPNQLTDYANTFVTVLVDYSPKIISAFVILLAFTPFGLLIDLSETMTKRNLDPTLTKFLPIFYFGF
jgi:small conductance mechanosensitive channel